MRFEPKTREELSNLLQEGIYKGHVKTAIEKTSRSERQMFALEVEIYDSEGRAKNVKDYIVLSEDMQWKLYDFCDSAGIMDRYNAGEVSAEDCLDRTVFCRVTRKEAEGDFPAKNEIKGYLTADKAEKLAKKAEKPTRGKAPVKRDPVPVPPVDPDCPF